MADTKKKRSSGRSSSSAGIRAGKKVRAPELLPRGMTPFKTRLIVVIVFFLLGIYAALGYFGWGKDSSFVRAMCNLFRGLFGWGYFVAPPLLIIAGVLLIYRYDKPWAIWRCVALLILIPLFGCIMQLIAGTTVPQGSLWASGMNLSSGGIVSGTLTSFLARIFTPAGTWVVLIPAILLLIAAALNVNFRKLFESYRENAPEREQAKKERQEKQHKRRAEEYDEHLREQGRQPRDRDRYGHAGHAAADQRGIYNQETDSTFGRRYSVSSSNEAEIRVSDPIPAGPGSETVSNWDWFFRSAEARQKAISSSGRAAADASNRSLRSRSGLDGSKENGSRRSTSEDMQKKNGDIHQAGTIDQHERKDSYSKGQASETKQSPNSDKKSNPSEYNTGSTKASGIHKTGLNGEKEHYTFPPAQLLQNPAAEKEPVPEKDLSDCLDQLFKGLRIDLKVTDFTRGPAVTQYLAEGKPGRQMSKLNEHEKDVELAVGNSSVRIGLVPDKPGTVSIEVPNKSCSTLYLREIIESDAFQKADSKTVFALGKGVDGSVDLGDLGSLHHLLVGGMPGSGKTTFLNSLILSLLYKATPEDVRFILLDPKMVEFRVYNGIPHLVSPVVTDPKKAAGALQWAVVEMMKRYRLFSEENTRDIDTYNTLMLDRQRTGRENKPLPRIIVIIDELADMMTVATKEVEDSICRVAQMGRAAGIHLVVATQSPLSDIVTDSINANIPSRCIFKMQNKKYSRSILGSSGSERLLGRGDMLFINCGTKEPKRIQGAWVSDEEREAVIEYLKEHAGGAEYDDEMIAEMDRLAENKSGGKAEDAPSGNDSDPFSDYDEVLSEAVDVALDAGQVSVSMLQRRLKLRYSRAARVVDQMEELGVIGPYEGAKPRQVLISRAQWQEMQMIQGAAPADTLPQELEDLFPDYEFIEDFPSYDGED